MIVYFKYSVINLFYCKDIINNKYVYEYSIK